MKIVAFIQRYMAFIILAVGAVSLFFPFLFTWISPSIINYMLALIMLLMGMTLNFNEFKEVLTKPKYILMGSFAQFIIMPSIALLLTKIFGLPTELAVGVLLVGCCPGGTASNVITYLSQGDVALSVGITTLSTLLAPILTPLTFWLLADSYIDINVLDMFFSIVKIVIIPIILGLLIQKYFSKATSHVTKVLPAFSVITIAIIVGIVISMNSSNLMTTGFTILCVVILHNLLGYLLGLLAGLAVKMSPKKCIALSIEIGMQNSGLACGLANAHFTALQQATVPGAIFSVWHNISGAIIARIFIYFQQRNAKEEQREVSE